MHPIPFCRKHAQNVEVVSACRRLDELGVEDLEPPSAAFNQGISGGVICFEDRN
jgi:hypothetical protein